MSELSDPENLLRELLGDAASVSAGKLNDDGKPGKCPICREKLAADTAHAPFCSARCKTIDLAKWADGDYKISRPIEEADLDQDD